MFDMREARGCPLRGLLSFQNPVLGVPDTLFPEVLEFADDLLGREPVIGVHSHQVLLDDC